MSGNKFKIPTAVYNFEGVRVRVCRYNDQIYVPMVDVLRAVGHRVNARRILGRMDPDSYIKLKIDHHTPTNLIDFNGMLEFLTRSRKFSKTDSYESRFHQWALDLIKGKKAATPTVRSIPISTSASDDAVIERLLNDPKSLQKMLLTILERNNEVAPVIVVESPIEATPKAEAPKKTINLDAIRRYTEQQGGLGIKDCAGVLGVKWAQVRNYAIEAGWATVGAQSSTLQPTRKGIDNQFMRIRENRRVVDKNEFVHNQPVIMPEGVIAMINHFDNN